jgi:hypothetical protein
VSLHKTSAKQFRTDPTHEPDQPELSMQPGGKKVSYSIDEAKGGV